MRRTRKPLEVIVKDQVKDQNHLEPYVAKHILPQTFYQVQYREKGKGNILAKIKKM